MNFNIQLFADAQTNTTGTMSVEMKTFYEKRLIDQAEPRLVHDQFADYYPVPQNGGKTIEFRKYDSLPKASTPLTEGVTPNGQALNVTSITSDLHQYGGWTPLTDVLQMTAIDNNVVQATRVLASQAGRTMDSIMAGFERHLDGLLGAVAEILAHRPVEVDIHKARQGVQPLGVQHLFALFRGGKGHDAAIADDDGAALKGVARGIDQCILKDHTKHLVLSFFYPV